MEIVATVVLVALILRITWSVVGDVRRSDWNSLAIHSIQMTCCGLGLALVAAFGGA